MKDRVYFGITIPAGNKHIKPKSFEEQYQKGRKGPRLRNWSNASIRVPSPVFDTARRTTRSIILQIFWQKPCPQEIARLPLVVLCWYSQRRQLYLQIDDWSTLGALSDPCYPCKELLRLHGQSFTGFNLLFPSRPLCKFIRIGRIGKRGWLPTFIEEASAIARSNANRLHLIKRKLVK